MDVLEAKARALYDECPTVKPSWSQLGNVTKGVWRENAARAIANEKELAWKRALE